MADTSKLNPEQMRRWLSNCIWLSSLSPADSARINLPVWEARAGIPPRQSRRRSPAVSAFPKHVPDCAFPKPATIDGATGKIALDERPHSESRDVWPSALQAPCAPPSPREAHRGSLQLRAPHRLTGPEPRRPYRRPRQIFTAASGDSPPWCAGQRA